jgi:uracil-DNA glycosylase
MASVTAAVAAEPWCATAHDQMISARGVHGGRAAVHNDGMKRADIDALRRHQRRVRACARCPDMHGPPVTGNPVMSPVLLIGQAPGPREIEARRPFAWTAGKTLFGWLDGIGLDERAVRQRLYMTAVCRCFPGKNPKGGDRVPGPEEVHNCSAWLQAEIAMLRPRLILPVGKLAIAQLMPVNRLNDVVGHRHRLTVHGVPADVVPLPHPSGASTWHRTEPGKSLLTEALELIRRHPAWRQLRRATSG